MFKKLLVALDGTPQSNVVLPFGRALALACGGELVLVRVIDPAVLSPDERQDRPLQVLRQLKRIADEFHMAGLQTDVRVSTGDPLTEIVRMSDVEHADALAVATHSSRLERLLDTSTVRRLIARSCVPVFVTRPGGRRVTHIRTLLAAVDGSPGGAQALDEAIALARMTNAALVLVRVVPSPEHFGFDPLLATTLGARPLGDSDERALAVAEEYVNVMADRIRRHGIDAIPKVMIGSAAERIVTAADQIDADLIVMSTHGYLAPVRTLLGSTAEKVLQSAGRPVLLVRRTDRLGQKPEHAHVPKTLTVQETCLHYAEEDFDGVRDRGTVYRC